MATITVPVKLVAFDMGTREGFKFQPKGITDLTYEEFLREVARGMKSPLAIVRGYFDYGNELIAQKVVNRKRVDFGFGDAYLTAHGSVQDPNASLKGRCELKVTVTPHQSVQALLDNAEIVNETLTVALVLGEIAETGHNELNKLYTENAEVVINTSCGIITSGRADEGVWLKNAAGEIVATATVTESVAGYTKVAFPTLPEPGDYKLVYACRNGESAESYTPAVKTRNVTVVG